MDTVTYPDDKVRSITREFVCIRVDMDQEAEVARKYGVDPMPDLRWLDPEGKEVARRAGFVSAAKLAAECRRVLDALAGRGGAAGAGGGVGATGRIVKPGWRPSAPTDAVIEATVERGLGWLRAESAHGWKVVEWGMGPEDMVLFTWAACGAAPEDGAAAELTRTVAARPLAGTYQAAFRALAFARLDPRGRRRELEECARFLVRGQLPNGQWTYRPARAEEGLGIGDNSNTAYALLGLAACRHAGIAVPEAPIRAAEAWWRRTQNADGGWGYRSDREAASYASMTESGMGSLILCAQLSGRGVLTDRGMERATAWLADHFSVSENRESAYQDGRLLYHLFALERVGSLIGLEQLAGHNWYRDGAAFLIATQRADGSWDDGAETPVPNTCFALLFLRRGTGFLR